VPQHGPSVEAILWSPHSLERSLSDKESNCVHFKCNNFVLKLVPSALHEMDLGIMSSEMCVLAAADVGDSGKVTWEALEIEMNTEIQMNTPESEKVFSAPPQNILQTCQWKESTNAERPDGKKETHTCVSYASSGMRSIVSAQSKEQCKVEALHFLLPDKTHEHTFAIRYMEENTNAGGRNNTDQSHHVTSTCAILTCLNQYYKAVTVDESYTQVSVWECVIIPTA